MKIHLVQSVPHFSLLGPVNTSQQFHHKALLDSICGLYKETELSVIQLFFRQKLNLIPDNHRDTVAGNGIKEKVQRRHISSQVKTQLG